MDHWLTLARAGTTSKVAAFGAPRWAYSKSFWEGEMALSEVEVKLCEVYERQGRADLAHCVRNARVHQLLDPFFWNRLLYSGRISTFLLVEPPRNEIDPRSRLDVGRDFVIPRGLKVDPLCKLATRTVDFD
jgi:hypothetical protein